MTAHTIRPARALRLSALGAAFALALTLTATALPAHAAKPRPDVIPSNPVERPTTGIPLPKPTQETSTVTFLPDVRVNYLGKSSGGGKTTYRFRVQNVGIGTASNVGLGNKIYQLANDGSVSTLQSGSSGTIGSLATDQSKEITVTCTPLSGYHCDGATLEAYLQNDLNPADNKATGG